MAIRTKETESGKKKKVSGVKEWNKLNEHISELTKDVSKEMKEAASEDTSLGAASENVYATDKMTRGTEKTLCYGVAVTKRINGKRNDKKSSGIRLRDMSVKTRDAICEEKTSGNNVNEAIVEGMSEEKISFGKNEILGGIGKAGKKSIDLLLKLIKEVLKFLLVKLSMMLLPLLIIGIIGSSFYNHVTRATSEMKKSFKDAFGISDEEYYEFDSSFEEERAYINAQIPMMVDYHNRKVQAVIDEHTGEYERVDLTKSEVDWSKFADMYFDIVVDKVQEGNAGDGKAIKEQMEDLYEETYEIFAEIITEVVTEEDEDVEIKVLSVSVEVRTEE